MEYTIKITRDENGLKFIRHNDGFSAFELIGFLQIIIHEIEHQVDNFAKIDRDVSCTIRKPKVKKK